MQKDGKRQPENFFYKTRATGGRPYKIHVFFHYYCASYGKLFYESEKPFVCLMYFRKSENTFIFWFTVGDTFRSALICVSDCFTCVAEARVGRRSEPFHSSEKPFVRPHISAMRK